MSRRLLPLWSAVLLLATTLVAYAGTTEAPASAASRTSGPLCGGSRTARINNRSWTCTFDDEFSGTSLDSAKWVAQTTPSSGWTTGDTCYVNNGTTISVGSGALHLVARKLSSPMSCGGAYSTSHTGGAVMSYNRFAQTYGRFEIRAKFPATDQAGFWGDLWLYPQNLTYGAWPASGEVDIAEHWSGHGQYVFSSLHYSGSSGADTRGCLVSDVSQFHTYAVEWGTSSMSFYFDGQLCFTRNWTTTTGSTKPFDKPFFVMLSEGFGDYNLPISSSLPATGPVDVDYVRVYR